VAGPELFAAVSQAGRSVESASDPSLTTPAARWGNRCVATRALSEYVEPSEPLARLAGARRDSQTVTPEGLRVEELIDGVRIRRATTKFNK
jgi:hypothetical protein